MELDEEAEQCGSDTSLTGGSTKGSCPRTEGSMGWSYCLQQDEGIK